MTLSALSLYVFQKIVSFGKSKSFNNILIELLVFSLMNFENYIF